MLPVVYRWLPVDYKNPDNDMTTRGFAMVALIRYGNVALRQFAEGEEYTLNVVEARTRASHSHYFAALGDAFDNLPEAFKVRFPSFDHWRKWLLIEEGFFDESEFECPDMEFARRLGMWCRKEDAYARILFEVTDDTAKVIVRRAKSQDMATMPREEFERSKKAVLDRASAEIGVARSELQRNAGRSA